ncbi:protein of unknown function [Paraburkholderia dioscoreae]|uniref:Uncharacterized protein n=1 Tax=Paraburkholderia dioscoreae TaxID=2604047 RepID=A0A5Q4ZKE5_9BURK|nr:protein of unknown function [Paraburkholderia dioscoreae]
MAKTCRLLVILHRVQWLGISRRLLRGASASTKSIHKVAPASPVEKEGPTVILTALIGERLNVGMQNTRRI